MCKTGNKIKLCTCLAGNDINTIIHHKQSKRHVKKKLEGTLGGIMWTLYRGYTTQNILDGLIKMPSNTLSGVLTDTELEARLNEEENCFDFEYIPQEGDYLNVYHKQDYIPYYYIGGKWTIGSGGFNKPDIKINFGAIKPDVE